MVAEKMYELGTKKSTIRTIFEFGRKRAAEVGEENVFDFSLGNPNVPTPEFVKQAVLDILGEMEPSAIHGYTIAPGNPEVREVLAKSINEYRIVASVPKAASSSALLTSGLVRRFTFASYS